MKKCSKCKIIKPKSDFPRQNKENGKVMSACKKCTSDRLKEKRKMFGDKIRERENELYQKYKDKRCAYMR